MAIRYLLLALLLVVVSYGQPSPSPTPSFVTVDNFLPTTEDQLPPPLGNLFATLPYDGDDDDWSTDLIERELDINGWDVYPVFLEINTTAEEALADAIDEANSGIQPFIGFANRLCGESVIKYITALRLRRSYVVDVDVTPFGFDTLFLSSLPSRKLCTDILQYCIAPAFPPALLDALIPFNGKCNARITDSLVGGLIVIPDQPLFPEESTQYIMLGSLQTFIPATDFDATPQYIPDCQDPLRFNQDNFYAGDLNERACQDHCLGYIFYSENQWQSAKILMGVMAWFCTITDLNLMIVLLMSEKNRRYPGILSVFMTIAGVFINLPFIAGAVVGLEEIVCEDEFTPATFDSGVCVWAAVSLNFGALMGLLTWSALAVNTYVTLHLRWRPDNFKWGIVTYIIVFGYPTIAVIVGLAAEDFQYTPPLPWCWWGSTGLEWGLFYACDIFCCFVSIFCIVFVLYELRNIQDSSKGKRAKFLKMVRVFAFLVLFLEIAVYLIVVQSLSTAREDKFTENTTAYGLCLLANVRECDRPADGEGTIAAATWYWLLANVTGTGLPVVLVFGTTGPVFFFWCRAVSNIASGKKLADGLSSSSSSSASSRGSWAGPQDGDEDSYDPDA